MSTAFQTAIAFEVCCTSGNEDEWMSMAVLNYDTNTRDYLIRLMDVALEMASRVSNFYRMVVGDWSPKLLKHCEEIEELSEKVEQDHIVYVPSLSVPESTVSRLDYSTMCVEPKGVYWTMCIKHTSIVWETVYFSRENVVNFLSPSRSLTDTSKKGT